MRYIVIAIILVLFFIYFTRERDIYFDNNATTHPHRQVYYAICGATCDNASSFYATAAKSCVETLKKMVLHKLGKPNSICILTSGASESNNLLFRGFASYGGGPDKIFTYSTLNGRIWCSAYEHKTSIECVRELRGVVLEPNNYVFCEGVQPKRGDLVSFMTMNNETGNIFNIWDIARRCKNAGVWFHTDITQFFGKITDETFDDVDCFSISFHKLYMMPGLGALVIPREMQIAAQISGTQNNGLRGGTESSAMCAGGIKTMEITFQDRKAKNAHLMALCQHLKNCLEKYRVPIPMKEFVNKSDTDVGLILEKYGNLPALSYITIPNTSAPINTVLVSFINVGPRFCNIKFRDMATQKGVKLSIGSACNTSVSGASHVLQALNIPFIVRAGVIRFSFGDYNTISEIDDMMRRITV